MRVVMVEVSPDFNQFGEVNLHCSSPKGGRSTVGHKVAHDDTAELVAAELARRIVNDRQWCTGYFETKTAGTSFMIICRDEVANVSIYGDPGVDVLKISEFGQ